MIIVGNWLLFKEVLQMRLNLKINAESTNSMAKQQLYMYHDQCFFREDHRRSFFPRLEIVTSKLMETDAENCIENF